MDLTNLVRNRPNLYHVTFQSNRESVMRDGLACSNDLKRRFKRDLRSLTAREGPIQLSPEVTLNDQIPMLPKVWERCKLPKGVDKPADWFRYLDDHVFFWTTVPQLRKFLKVRNNHNYKSIVFQAKTSEIIDVYQKHIFLSTQNTGGPYAPNPAPREYFYSTKEFPTGKRLVELVLDTPMTIPELLTEVPESDWPKDIT